MILSIFFNIIIPLLPILKKAISSFKKALLIYYSIVIIFVILFYKIIFIENNSVNDFMTLLKSISVIFFPIVYFLSIKENINIIKTMDVFLFYILCPLSLILKIYLIYKYNWSNEIAGDFLAIDFVLGIYLSGTIITLLPAVILDKLKYSEKL